MSSPAPAKDRVERALELLSEEVRRQLASHPAGHLLGGHESAVQVTLRVPVLPRDGDLARATEAAGAALAAELNSLLTQRALFRPGRVYCLRCASVDCEHAAPASCREVFAGYGPSGMPRFQELGPFLLERGDARIDQLYEEPPRHLAHRSSGAELSARLLPAYRDRNTGFHLHGQVAAGWYRGRDANGHSELVALTFQVASTRTSQARRLYGLNIVGTGPGGESLEAFCSRLGEIPWTGAVRWAQGVLEQIGTARKGNDELRERRIEGLLKGLAARLEKGQRAEGRRTRHAKERHREGDRPTRMALADLASAGADSLLVDNRRDTLIVLGERGRAHVWSRDGKLVTSIRYAPEAIERKRKEGLWREARGEEVQGLKQAITFPPRGNPIQNPL